MLTIFTPTYNRKYILPKLYNSLVNQTNKNFTWLIVDDGSTDGTEELVNNWITEGKIKIEYIYQINAGKMQAHNKGVLNTKTELFLCVDSDDHVTEQTVEDIITSYKEWQTNDDLAGIVAYRGRDSQQPLGNEFPQDVNISKLDDLYKNGFKGDTSLVYRTKILQQYLFPKIEGEKFITENFIYTQIDQSYQLVVLPKIFIVCEYLDDGYSKNIYKVFNRNPKGMALYYNLKTKLATNVIERIKYSIAYVCYSRIAKNTNAFKESNCKVCYVLAFIPGILLYLKRKNLK